LTYPFDSLDYLKLFILCYRLKNLALFGGEHRNTTLLNDTSKKISFHRLLKINSNMVILCYPSVKLGERCAGTPLCLLGLRKKITTQANIEGCGKVFANIGSNAECSQSPLCP